MSRRYEFLGLSLTETIVAFFIITVGVLEVTSLFQSAWSAQKRTANVAIATVIATKNMAWVRDWAATGTNFNNWALIEGQTTPDPQYPDYVVTLNSEYAVQYSPCSLSELRYPPAEQRRMDRSLRKVRVRVSWDASRPSEKIDLVALVGEPTRVLDSLALTPVGVVPNPIRQLDTATFKVAGSDSKGVPIADLFFEWTVIPLTGSGQISTMSRDGRSAKFQNLSYVDPATGDNVFSYIGSTCDVWVQGNYCGVSKTASQTMTLGGP